jgi:hypothetical protein
MAAVPLAPGAGSELTAAKVPGLPALAPVRVVLTVARGHADRDKRAMDVMQALVAAGVEVANVAAVPAPTVTPGIGYYFHSDRDAAVGSRRSSRGSANDLAVLSRLSRARPLIERHGTGNASRI